MCNLKNNDGAKAFCFAPQIIEKSLLCSDVVGKSLPLEVIEFFQKFGNNIMDTKIT